MCLLTAKAVLATVAATVALMITLATRAALRRVINVGAIASILHLSLAGVSAPRDRAAPPPIVPEVLGRSHGGAVFGTALINGSVFYSDSLSYELRKVSRSGGETLTVMTGSNRAPLRLLHRSRTVFGLTT